MRGPEPEPEQAPADPVGTMYCTPDLGNTGTRWHLAPISRAPVSRKTPDVVQPWNKDAKCYFTLGPNNRGCISQIKDKGVILFTHR